MNNFLTFKIFLKENLEFNVDVRDIGSSLVFSGDYGVGLT